MKIEINLSITDKMLNYFLELPIKKDGDIDLPFVLNNVDKRYLSNFVLCYEIPISRGDEYSAPMSKFCLSTVGKQIRKSYIK